MGNLGWSIKNIFPELFDRDHELYETFIVVKELNRQENYCLLNMPCRSHTFKVLLTALPTGIELKINQCLKVRANIGTIYPENIRIRDYEIIEAAKP